MMARLVEAGDRLAVIEADPEFTITRDLRTDLSLRVSTCSKKLRLTHYGKRLIRGRHQSLAIGAKANYCD